MSASVRPVSSSESRGTRGSGAPCMTLDKIQISAPYRSISYPQRHYFLLSAFAHRQRPNQGSAPAISSTLPMFLSSFLLVPVCHVSSQRLTGRFPHRQPHGLLGGERAAHADELRHSERLRHVQHDVVRLVEHVR